MQYPFSTIEPYMTAEELRRFERFYRDGFKGGEIYTNASGEKRQILRIFLPRGCKTKNTVWGPEPKPGVKFYFTPEADAPGATVMINWKKPGSGKPGIQGRCNDLEWYEWLGDRFEQEAAPEVPAETKAEKSARAAIVGRYKSVQNQKVDKAKKKVDEDDRKPRK